jgi:FkbH-like protein
VVVIGATFVAEPIEGPLKLLLGVAGLGTETVFCPYNQVFSQLLSPASEFARNADGANLLFVRLEDFVRDQKDPAAARETLARSVGELADALSSFQGRTRTPLILGVLPVSPAISPELRDAAEAASAALSARVAGLPGLQVLNADALARNAGDQVYDPVRDRYAHIPYTDEGYADLARVTVRLLHSLQTPPCKVLVLDCDNTLWRGVVGEEGVDGIEISPAFRALQAYAVQLESKGTLICLASKNAEADVLAVLERRDDMVLKAAQIATHRINWLPKPANIRAMAEELNLGLDAFVFVDDNPVECAQVRAELPMVVTLQLPAEELIPAFIDNLWTFDKLVATEEDRNRTRMYRENAARRSLESSAADMGQFLAALELKVGIDVPGEDEWPRVAQLTQRTNQFNFTTQRRSEAQLRAVSGAGGYVRRVRVSDRFGDYGLVGVMQAHVEAGALFLDNLLLSCRVLGRGVEHAMLRHLGGIAAEQGLSGVQMTLLTTPRNEPARAFLDSVAAQFAQRQEAGAQYRVPAAFMQSIEHRPGQDPAEVMAASRAEGRSAQADVLPGAADSGRSERYLALATGLATAAGVLQRLQAGKRRIHRATAGIAAPQSDAERQMLGIWERVLGVEGIGVEDDYFALGGTSLQSVQLFAEIARVFGAELRLTSILEAATVRRLAALVAAEQAGASRDGLVCLRAGQVKNLFLIHDGLGETLLYRNLALSLPPGIAVYGIEPTTLPGIALASATMEDLAAHYVASVRRVQPAGPYYLGGMCAGGTIAYAMACHFASLGETVNLVAILDGATPSARPRGGARLSRLRESLTQQRSAARSPVAAALGLLGTVLRKARNFIAYETRHFVAGVSWRRRTAVFRRVMTHGGDWPRGLRRLTVAEIYTYLESRYQPPPLAQGLVMLVRATAGQDGDQPFREIYSEADLGWGSLVQRLEVADVEGGHSSMLQAQHVHALAGVLAGKLAAPATGSPH